jgi:hypothetical protein
MYLDEVFNNFLGTLRPLPDLRQNNPSLEHGKFVTDKSKYYAGKSMMISTDNSIDGTGKNTEIKIHVPSQCLMNRTSAPDLDSIVEGFDIGERVIEGNTNQCVVDPATRADLTTALAQYDSLNREYAASLEKYSKFKKNSAYSNYLNKFVKYTNETSSPPATEVYYINDYGFKYRVPALSVPALPAGVVLPSGLVFNMDSMPIISKVNFDALPSPTLTSATAYVIKAGQDLTLAGTMVKYPETVESVVVNKYLWVDVEGVAHKFPTSILSDARTNASSPCQLKLLSTRPFATKAAFDTAIGKSVTGPTATTELVGSDIASSAYMCSDLPNEIIAKKDLVDAQETAIKIALNSVYANLPNCSLSQYQGTEINNYVIENKNNGGYSLNIPSSTQDQANVIRGGMPTYDGKVKDTFKNVKSKLAYYLLWLAFMIFIVVVTFRNMADSGGPESGSFQASAAILFVLVIYLFNFLSDMRLGPNQAIANFFGALPEKASAMMKFTFT